MIYKIPAITVTQILGCVKLNQRKWAWSVNPPLEGHFSETYSPYKTGICTRSGKHPSIVFIGFIPYALYFSIISWFAAIFSSCVFEFLILSCIFVISGLTMLIFLRIKCPFLD